MKKKSSSSQRRQRGKKPRTTRTLRERLSIVRQRWKEGKPQRQIADELACDEGTVRRDISILQLPADWVKRIENGEPAEPFLREARIAAAREEQQQRLQAETQTGHHSDEIAKEVLAWLMTKPLLRVDEEMIIDKVDRKLCDACKITAAPRRDVGKTLAHCERDTLPYDSSDEIECCTNVLSQTLLLVAPEKLIRDNAINKIAAAVRQPTRRPPPPRRPFGVYTVTIPRRPY
jgi:hypothetical protein